MSPTKAQLRGQMRRRLAELTEAQRVQASGLICDAVARLTAWRLARTVMCYVSMATEVQTGRLIELAWAQRKRLLVPHVDWEAKVMIAQPLESWERLAVGKYGTMQSPRSQAADPDEIDVVLAPGLAFDRSGNRLGRGGGFFDRFLPGTRAMVIGLAFDCQIVERVPREHHDVPVRMVLTEQGAIELKAAT